MSTTLYTTGTISLTNGQTAVVGVGTLWSLLVDGDLLIAPDGKIYELTFTDDTHATLDRAYAGTTVSGSAYSIMRNSLARDSVRAASKQLSDIAALYRDMYTISGSDRMLKLNKATTTDSAGIRLQRNSEDLYRIGIHGDDILSFDYLQGLTWVKAFSMDPAGAISLKGTITSVDSFGFDLKGAAATERKFTYYTDDKKRFDIALDSAAEAGANAGSDIVMRTYNDAGGLLATALKITRATAAIALAAALTVGSTLAVAGAATLSSTLAVTGNTSVGGILGVTGNASIGGTLGITGATTISNNTAATSTSTGALKVTGGGGFGGNIYSGGNVVATGYGRFDGYIGVGGVTPSALYGAWIGGTLTGGTSVFGIRVAPTADVGATSSVNGFYSTINIAAGSQTVSSLAHFRTAGTAVGAGATLTSQYGFLVDSSMTAGVTNYAFYSALAASGSSRYNLYMGGTAPNYLAGTLQVADTTASNSSATGAFRVGGGIGAGGAIYAGSSIVSGGAIYAQPATGNASIIINASTAGNQSVLSFRDAGTVEWDVYRHTDNNLCFWDGTAGGNAMRLLSGGTLSSGRLHVDYSTVSTSYTSGAITTAGGLGVTGNAYIGGTLNVSGTHVNYMGDIDTAKWATSLGAYALSFLSDHTDTYSAPSGSGSKTINGRTYRPKVVMSNQGFIYSARSHVTDTQAGGMVEMRAENGGTTNGTLARSVLSLNNIANAYLITQVYTNGAGTQVAQFATGSGVANLLYSAPGHIFTAADSVTQFATISSSRLYVPLTTASTSTTSGSGVFAGGLGVAGNGYFGGVVNVAGNTVTQGSHFVYNDLNMTRSGGGGTTAYIVLDDVVTTTFAIAKNGGGNITAFVAYADSSSFAGPVYINHASANLYINSTTAANQGRLTFQASGVEKWLLYKQGTSHTLAVFDVANTLDAMAFTAGTRINVGYTTAATSTTAAALVVAGGIASAKDVFAGKALHFGTGSDAYGPGSIFADATHGMLLRGYTASPTTYEFAFYNQANTRRFWVDTSGKLQIDQQLLIGIGAGAQGSLTLMGATSGSAIITTAAVAGTTNFRLPVGNGSSGQVLSTDGSGNTSWANAGGASAVDWQSFGLSLIYQAKLNGAYRRLPRFFADGFAGSDGIYGAGSSNYTQDAVNDRVYPSSAAATSYANTGGAGNRTASITASSTVTITGGAASGLIDGTKTGAGPTYFANGQTSGSIVWDFGAGNAKYIDEIKIYMNASTAGTNGTWAWEASNDNSNWTTILSNFALTFTSAGDQSVTVAVPGATQTYRYWRMRLNGGTATTSGPYVDEIEFKLSASAPSPANMTLVTNAQTSASVTKAKAVLEIDNSDAPTLNTDLTIEFTCNNGTNWTAATLSDAGLAQSGRKCLETTEVTCTAGTLFGARIKTFNGKSIPIHGLCVAVS